MTVYDFDGTIYCGNSTVDFYLFVLRRKPWLVWTVIPNIYNAVLFKIGALRRERFKERYFQLFLPFIETDRAVKEFWDDNEQGIKKWYLKQKKSNDLIISASPEFLLGHICSQLGIDLIATKVNPETGKFESENCRGKEKVRRYHEMYGSQKIDVFYTDHKSDKPLMELAGASYMVKNERITKLGPTSSDTRAQKLIFDKRIRFLLVGGTAAIIDFGLLNILSLFFSKIIIANILSTGVAMIFSFILNKNFTFNSKSKKYFKEVTLFFIFTAFGLWIIQNLVISAVLTMIPVKWSGFVKLNLAKAIGTLVSMCWNYLAYSRFVFRGDKLRDLCGEP